jgi:sugar phosphate isomerase/epimerase
MILGICAGTDRENVKAVKEIGYRYIETWLPALYGAENKEKYEEFLKTLDETKIRCEVGQFAFPGEYNPEGKQTEEALEKVRDYVNNLISATADLNIEKLVIGAGGARVLPSPDVFDNVMEQMADILKYAVSPVLDRFGIIATVEGLVKRETPILNTTEQSVALAKLVNIPNVKVMIDLYHAANEDKDLDFTPYKGYIMHSHIGKPQPRLMPAPDDGYDYKPFFDGLRAGGFNGRMSVEAGLNAPDFKTSALNSFNALSPLL